MPHTYGSGTYGDATYGDTTRTYWPSPPRLIWDLTDLNQNLLATLDNRKPGAKVTFALNTGRSATVQLALDEPAVGQVAAQECLLRCLSDEWPDPLAIGRVTIPEESSESQAITLNARDPWQMLEGAHIADSYPAAKPPILAGRVFIADQSQIMADLVAYCAANGHGIVTGELAPPSTVRQLSYGVGAQIAQALKDIAALQFGPDFELRPVIADDGTIAALDTFYPKLGIDRTAWPYEVIFEYGHGDENVLSYTRTPAGDQLCNRYIGVGAQKSEDNPFRLAYIAEHAASQDEFGVFEVFEIRDTTTRIDTLEAWSKGQVAQRAYPVPYFTFKTAPEEGGGVGYGQPFRFGRHRDYYLGDIIGLRVQPEWSDDPADRFTLTGRVVQTDLIETEAGTLVVENTVAPDIAIAAGVTGAIYDADP